MPDSLLEMQFADSYLESPEISQPSKEIEQTGQHTTGCILGEEELREMAKNFQDEEDGFVLVSFEKLQLGRVHGLRHNSDGNASKRISVTDFSVPKFTMRLAANQGNPKQLAALLAAKQKNKKRMLRPKREYYSPVTPQEAIPGPSNDPRPESSGKRMSFVFRDQTRK